MDNDFSEKLKSVLSDPDAMAKIMSIASGLGASEPQAEQGNVDAAADSKESEANAMPAFSGGLGIQSDPRIALLSSLKPLLREEKRDRIDALVRAFTLAAVMKGFRR